jgi:hypothetical protein
LICHLGLLYHYRVSFVLDVFHHSKILPSSFLLGGLPKRHMWKVFHINYIGFSWLHIVVVWQFSLSDFAFFYSAENKPPLNGDSSIGFSARLSFSATFCTLSGLSSFFILLQIITQRRLSFRS